MRQMWNFFKEKYLGQIKSSFIISDTDLCQCGKLQWQISVIYRIERWTHYIKDHDWLVSTSNSLKRYFFHLIKHYINELINNFGRFSKVSDNKFFDPHPRCSSLHRTDFEGLPPALFIVGDMDPLRDENYGKPI